MDKKQAFEILVKAMEIANKAGAFDLKSSATIYSALQVVEEIVFQERKELLKSEPKTVTKAVRKVSKVK